MGIILVPTSSGTLRIKWDNVYETHFLERIICQLMLAIDKNDRNGEWITGADTARKCWLGRQTQVYLTQNPHPFHCATIFKYPNQERYLRKTCRRVIYLVIIIFIIFCSRYSQQDTFCELNIFWASYYYREKLYFAGINYSSNPAIS